MKNTNLIEMVEHLGQIDRDARFENLQSLVTSEYRIDRSTTEQNLVIPAKNKENMITLSGHWDNYPGSNGYNDNASAMAVLLSLQGKLPDNVEILFSDHEESGGGGVLFYSEENDPVLNINLDVVGYGSKIFYDTYGDFISPKSLTEGVEYWPGVPFNDSFVFSSRGVNSILLITGNSDREVIGDIWERQHGGVLDNDIKQVNASSIQMVIDQLDNFFNKKDN